MRNADGNDGPIFSTFNDGSGSGLDADLLDGVDSLTRSASHRANKNITGGGTVTVDASGNVLWASRFIVISNGRGSYFSTTGYFDIECPTSGTITGVGGATNVTATAAGIPLGAWQAIYYILPIGSTNATVAANFRVASYTGDVNIPHDWVLICVRNSDNGAVYFNNGMVLVNGQSMNGLIQTNANTANTLVRRDASGNFSAGTITAALSGNASTATSAATLTTARNIGGTSFNGSADITPFRSNTIPTIDAGTIMPSTVVAYGSRAVSSAPNNYAYGINWEFKNASTFSVTGNYAGLLTLAPWLGTTVSTGDPSYQLLFNPTAANSTSPPNLRLRAGIDTTWGAWSTIWHSGNDGSGSGLDADTLDGENLVDNAATANTVVGRDASANVIANDFNSTSDIKLKKNIQTLTNSLDKVLSMRGVEFDRIDIEGKHQIGFIAQEVESIIPELVSENQGTKSVAYGNITALLVEAIKEQQTQINNLINQINELKK
jgi:hypothetical protein